jgi:DNA-binding XRE family transcriptional regulator
VNKNLRILSPGEQLWAWRRAAGHSQAVAAGLLGVCRTTLWRAEADVATAVQGIPPVSAAGVALPLARRRQGWGLEGTACRVGVSHVTLLRMEREGDRRLREFWVGRGFIF